MKKILAFGLSVVLLASCDNTLDINANYDVVNVVYGLLDKDQDTQWVRLHRTYLGTDGLLAGATHSDSLYFEEANLFLAELNANGDVLATVPLVRKDTQLLDPGIFTTENYRLYYTNTTLDPSRDYRLTGFIP